MSIRANALRRARGLSGRLYEAALRLGLVKYRKPFAYYSTDVWNQGYAIDEHDHYASIGDTTRYGALVGYMQIRGAPLDILDVGCGTGVLRGRIPEALIARYVGTDTANVPIAKAAEQGWANSEFLCTGEPGSDLGGFDIIVCNEMLYLVDDLEGLLVRLRGLLKPDGWLLTSNTRYHGDFVLHRALARIFHPVDLATITNPIGQRKWNMGCYGLKRPGSPDPRG